MSRVRITCRRPNDPAPPSLADCDIFVVLEDGTEHRLANVTRIAWSVGGVEPARAVLELEGVEVDVDAITLPSLEASP